MNFLNGLALNNDLVVVLFLATAFLIGFIIGRIIGFRNTRIARRESSVAQEGQRIAETNLAAADEKYAVREADLKRQSIEIERLSRNLRENEAQKMQLQADIEANRLNLQQAKKQQENAQNQINTLQAAVNLHTYEISAAANQVLQAQEASAELRKRIGNIDEEMLKQLQQDVTSLRYVNALLIQERDDLQRTLDETAQSLETLLQKKESEDVRRVYVISNTNKANPENEILLTQGEAQQQLSSMINEFLPYSSAADADDLKLINGIGPFIEEKLNAAGIHTFEQISLFDEEFINTLTAAIGFFPDRIKRGRWVEQAKELWEEKEQSKLSLPHRDPDTNQGIESYG